MFDTSEMTERDWLESEASALGPLARLIHARNIEAGWWKKDEEGNLIERNVPEMLMLIVSEIAEAMEGHRKSLPDDKLPQYPMIVVELVDALIREFDLLGRLCEVHDLDLSEVFMAKVDFNANREDHKLENRMAPGGKAY